MTRSRAALHPQAAAECSITALRWVALTSGLTFLVSGAWTVHTVLSYIDNTYAASEAAVGTPRLIATVSLGLLVLSGAALVVLYWTTRWRFDKRTGTWLRS
jgi:hypothetical protein